MGQSRPPPFDAMLVHSSTNDSDLPLNTISALSGYSQQAMGGIYQPFSLVQPISVLGVDSSQLDDSLSLRPDSSTRTFGRLCHDPRGWGPYAEDNDFTPCAEEGALTVIQGLFLVLVVGWAASRWLRRGKAQVVVEGVSQECKSPLVLKGKLVSFSLSVLPW